MFRRVLFGLFVAVVTLTAVGPVSPIAQAAKLPKSDIKVLAPGKPDPTKQVFYGRKDKKLWVRVIIDDGQPQTIVVQIPMGKYTAKTLLDGLKLPYKSSTYGSQALLTSLRGTDNSNTALTYWYVGYTPVWRVSSENDLYTLEPIVESDWIVTYNDDLFNKVSFNQLSLAPLNPYVPKDLRDQPEANALGRRLCSPVLHFKYMPAL